MTSTTSPRSASISALHFSHSVSISGIFIHLFLLVKQAFFQLIIVLSEFSVRRKTLVNKCFKEILDDFSYLCWAKRYLKLVKCMKNPTLMNNHCNKYKSNIHTMSLLISLTIIYTLPEFCFIKSNLKGLVKVLNSNKTLFCQ